MLASIIPMMINLLINPLVALNMEPVDYAIVGYYNSFNGLLSPLITFYVFSYYTKRYFELQEADRIILKSTILKSLIYFSALLAVISLFSLYLYMTLFNKGSEMPFFPYAFLSVFSLPITGVVTLRLIDFKMEKKSHSYFKLSVSQGVLLAVLTLLLVVGFKFGAVGKMSATFIATLTVFMFCIYKEYDAFKNKFDWKIFKTMLLFVWPMIIGAMLHFFTNGYDRVYLERLGDNNELGYYVVGGQVVGYIGAFSSAVSSTFQPDVYKAVVNRKWKNASKYIGLILASTAFFVLIFVLLAPFVIDLLTAGRYTYSAKYARILAFSQLTSTMYFVTTEITIVLGYTIISLISKIFGVLFTIILYSLMISQFQFAGAAWGQVLSFLLMMLINLIFLIIWHTYKNKRNTGILA